jgi:hypothetical protein
MATSHADKILARQTTLVYFFTTLNNENVEEYVYLAMRADKLPDFQKAIASGCIEPSQFGTILASGVGMPTDEIVERMKNDYGCIHHNEV